MANLSTDTSRTFEALHAWTLARLDQMHANAPKGAKGMVARMRWELRAYPLVGPRPLDPMALGRATNGSTLEELKALDREQKAFYAANNEWEERAQAALPEDD